MAQEQERHDTLTHVSPILTNSYLDERLSEWFQKKVKFTHWEYVGETGKGDSYLSELIRIKIFGENENGEEESVQVILKSIPKSVSRRLTYRCDEFFKNEIQFYKFVLPEMLKFQKQKDVKDPFLNYAEVFAAYTDGINDIIALEDVSLQDFGSPIRQEGIDFDHCKIVMKTFAKFHAISFAMKDQDPDAFNEMQKHIFETYYCNENWGWYERFWKRISNIAIDAVEKEYPDSIYVEKIKEFASPATFNKMVDAATNTKATGVISHGDSWTNNFLFKYPTNSSVPSDAKMIDFQLTRCATPTLDVTYFIYACTGQDLRNKYYHELLKFYYETLSTQIRELGSDPDKVYSWELFMSEVKKYSYFALAFSFESTPMIVLDPEDAIDMEMEGTEKKNIDDIWTVKPFKTQAGRLRDKPTM